jgi:drug/metabolite transporter (DMT)-like permease
MFPSDLLGILFALSSAFVWGSGDFCGGLAARKNQVFQVLILSTLSGIGVLLVFAFLWKEPLPSGPSMLWAMAAGVSGVLGISALYRALSLGHMAGVAPIAAVIGALLPMGFSSLSEGPPQAIRLIGFIFALLSIWLVSRSSIKNRGMSREELLLACLAGIGFGGFFILLAQVERGFVFTPLVLTRCVSFLTALILLRMRRLAWPSLRANPAALLAGMLDAGGNVFFLLARQYTRLDVATVLGSLYPAATVLLAWLVLKEKVSKLQGVGLLFCLLSVVLITL